MKKSRLREVRSQRSYNQEVANLESEKKSASFKGRDPQHQGRLAFERKYKKWKNKYLLFLSWWLRPWNHGSKTLEGTTWHERCGIPAPEHVLLTVVCFLRHRKPSPTVCPECPLLPRRITTEALFRVSFKKTDDPYYQLLKTGIWVMVWDFIGILFLLLLIILQWAARSFLGMGGWGRGERSHSPPLARWDRRPLGACLPATWTTVHVFLFPGWPVFSWMATTSGPGRGQGGSQWSPGAFIAPNQVNLISLLTKSFHESEQTQHWPNGCKERGQIKKKEYRPSDC